MRHDDAYHWSPELLDLLIETVPRLSKSKDGVLAFLRGAGVSESLLAEFREQLRIDRSTVNKFKMARSVLGQINEQGDQALGVRRELLRRVLDFQEFSLLWPEDQHVAKGLIADVRNIVNVRDSFTRMNQEREAERNARIAARRTEQEKINRQRRRLRELSAQLTALFALQDPHARGTALERVLNQIFDSSGVLVRDSFALRNEEGQTGEQIDGVISVDGAEYIVEVKWWSKPVDIDPMCRQLVRVFNRAGVRGLFISASGYTTPAVDECVRALTSRVIILGELRELVLLLEREGDIAKWVQDKARMATLERRPLALWGVDF
ncbi:restriction endonuclease [Streptomyces sp. NPDC017086]|uniref:restriction endonuclease n=1 Tax=Streptomyces sp. NPDC017086 TaxID=3364976 RepID=UPI00378CA38D